MVDNPVENRRGNTPPMFDLETLKSDLVIADIDGSTEEVWPKASWKGFVGWTLAAIAAIVVGVIPALWINRWRGESSAEAAVAPAPAETAATTPSVEPIEQPVPTPAPTPTIAIKAPEHTATSKPQTQVKAPKHIRKVKQPVSRPPKKTPPACNIYLHPHGCPQ